MKARKTLCALLAALFTFSLASTACNNATKPSSETSSAPSPSSDFSISDSDLSVSDSDENSDSFFSDSSSDSEEDEDFLLAQEIMDRAYALSNYETLDDGTYFTLEGVVTSISGKNASMRVNEPNYREIYCYQLQGSDVSKLMKGATITVCGPIKNYKGTIEFFEPDLLSYTLAIDNDDPYANVSKSEFYKNYTPATSAKDARYRSQHHLMSGTLETPDQAPTLSSVRPKSGNAYIRNEAMRYSDYNNAYTVCDYLGNEKFTVYRGGAYITLEEVAAYVYAFGNIPANYISEKDTDASAASPKNNDWGEYLRLNYTPFSGSTSKYPYEPQLPNISGCGGTLHYYEMDIGTTGTDCDPKYTAKIYNDGNKITRGAARIVYGKQDLNFNNVYEEGEFYLFYTYNHYNDFQEYLNYYGGWGEMFGNITGGGTISSTKDYNPTDYVPVVISALPTARNAVLARMPLNELYSSVLAA